MFHFVAESFILKKIWNSRTQLIHSPCTMSHYVVQSQVISVTENCNGILL